jgi:hypothetical protein
VSRSGRAEHTEGAAPSQGHGPGGTAPNSG